MSFVKDRKNLLISCLLAVLALALLILILVNIEWSILPYGSFEQDGYRITYRGNARGILSVRIKAPDGSRSRLSFEADKKLLKEHDAALIAYDLDGDDDTDLLLPFSANDKGELRYRGLLCEDGAFSVSSELSDLANPSFDEIDGVLTTSNYDIHYLEEPTDNKPPLYEERFEIARYDVIDGALRCAEVRAITYYSENDYCCYSIYAYSAEYEELMYVDEQWFEPDDMNEYPLEW